MRDELHLRNIFANLNIKCSKCMFTGFRVTHHHRFPTKIAQPQITPGSPWNGTQIGLRRRLMSKVSSRCAKLSEAKVLLVSERWIFLLKLRGAVRKPVKNGQNMSGGRWCFVCFESVPFFLEYIQICVHSDWRWVMMNTTIKHHQVSESQVVFQTADLLRKLGIPINTPKAGDHHRYGGFQFQSPFVNPLCQTCGSRIAMSHW